MKSSQSLHKRREYLKLWRKVKKDGKLKAPPCYFTLAAKSKLDVSSIKSPSIRCCLKCLSAMHNMMDADCVLRLNKSLGRNSLRSDGLVPTLTSGCTRMFVPAAAVTFSVSQLLCLSGIHPQVHKAVHQAACETTLNDMDSLISSTMVVPVIGTIMAVALRMLDPQKV
jgi:hypothetical protein